MGVWFSSFQPAIPKNAGSTRTTSVDCLRVLRVMRVMQLAHTQVVFTCGRRGDQAAARAGAAPSSPQPTRAVGPHSLSLSLSP